MNNVFEIKDIDAVMLTDLVRQTLRSPTAEISEWASHPISYIHTEESNLGLYRFKGTAADQGEVRPWSIMLKAVHAPANESNPTYWNYHRREILAYQSGLLTDLPAGLSAPRCLGITEQAEGVCWLWLEDVLDSASRSWSLTEYNIAARHLGRFNGAYVTGYPLPSQPWLSQNWMRGWLAEWDPGCQETVRLIREPHFWEQPLLVSAFPQSITDAVLQLWHSHNALLAVLDQLPRTFCHMDAYRPNLFIRRDTQGTAQTVAIDWVFAGIGVLGEEIANVLPASLSWFEYDAAEAESLDQAIFAGYMDGLRNAGWQGDQRLVRLGYTAACALRWGVVGLWWLNSLSNAEKLAELEKEWRRPMPEFASQLAKTTYHVLGLAAEAYQLQREFFAM